MQAIEITSVPEQGQIVTVRQRRFVVNDIQKSTLPDDPLMPTLDGAQHLVTLSSIEDDALGETLQVIWEIEPGARIDESIGLPQPNGFDSPERLDAFLNAVRWGAVSSADVRALQAPFRSGVDIEDYQLDPLVRAIQMPRVNLLIADDVGLGKTVEAGLVIQELIVRSRAQSVLVVCPAGLQIHWRDQMRDKFGLEFRIVDTELMKELRRSRGIHVNPWSHFPRLITSLDFIKRDRPLRLFRETVPNEVTYPRRFDILVVDEAHNIAPAGGGHFSIDSQRTEAIRQIAPHFEHKLFLTATPHNGYIESFTALLELLDNQRFARSVYPDRRQLESIMVRRMKSEIKSWDGNLRFPIRQLDVIEVNYSDAEKQVHRWLREYSELRQKNARDHEERFAIEFVLKLLKKRLFSSPAAFDSTLQKHIASVSNAKKKQAKSIGSNIGILRRQINQIDESYDDDQAYEEDTSGTVETASLLFGELTPREQYLLKAMEEWAGRSALRADSKAEAFINWLETIVRPGGQWSDERVIIFTEYRATQNWLQTILSTRGLTANKRLMLLYGGMDGEEREQIKAAFQSTPDLSPIRILLATDAASEGIDLQNHCYRLVHFEIPWNPNRMEQRNGRIDRHGQTHNPLIYHFVSSGFKNQQEILGTEKDDLDADLEFLFRAVQKLETIREDIGKVGPVIAQQVEEAMLNHNRQLDTARVEAENKATTRMFKFDRDLNKQISQLYDQLQETKRELQITPENIEAVVKVALEIADQPPIQLVTLDDSNFNGKAFALPPLSGSWASCITGLAHPLTGKVRPIVFDNESARGREDVVLAHLNHRLVQMALRLLRAEVWSPEGRKGLHRVTARIVPNDALDSPAVIAHARLVVIGGDSHRLHEEIITAGGFLRGGVINDSGFSRMNVGQVQAALNAATTHNVNPSMQERLSILWPSIQSSLMSALESRMQDRLSGIQKKLEERKSGETSDITAILNELATAIRTELIEMKASPYQQLELWTDSEREQLRRNEQALRMRLEQIPNELEKEVEASRKRYADPKPRLFPVAVTFLVPEKFANQRGNNE
jgi:SNF2 family DNA or RNA helicase